MTAESAHVGRWRRELGAPGRLWVQRRYERTVGALEREGNHAAPACARRSTARPRRGPVDEPPGGRARNAGAPRVLFATSNGTGLGHLNRAMAIARRLPDASSPRSSPSRRRRAGRRRATAIAVDYLASYRRPALGHRPGLEPAAAAPCSSSCFEERRPDLVVFDGVHPYRALTHVLSARGAPRSIWCRRAMWRAGPRSRRPLDRAGAFDAVLEPGELAESADRGPTVSPARSREARRADRLPRPGRAARSRGGRRPPSSASIPARRTALVSLGSGRRGRPRRRRVARAPWPRSRTSRSRRCSRASPPASRSRRASSASMRPSR